MSLAFVYARNHKMTEPVSILTTRVDARERPRYPPTWHAVAVLLAVGSGVSCHRLIPATRPPFTITGVVMSVDVDKLLLRHKSGYRVPILIVPATRVVRRGQPAVIADIKTGMRIV